MSRNRLWQDASFGALIAALASPALAQEAVASFDIPTQPLAQGLLELGRQARVSVAAPQELVAGRTGRSVEGDLTTRAALAQLLDGSGLRYEFVAGDAVRIVSAQGPQGGSAGGDVDALIVTAQKREENIQDVPIAISAFSQEDLTTSQIAGGPDLITQVPNMTFTKTNFSSYSIQLRGVGTQAISATVDPAVAVAFNNTPFIRNRFFEQEFYDLERIEVLRGPQGTLYGRNATAGVVNIISGKPRFVHEAKVSADVANYNSSRLEGMVNLPLVEDKVALRLAGAWTKRDGYATNEVSGKPIDGRDLWSTRMSLRFAPTDALDVNLIWEHFEEDDDRLRSGKQLCKTDVVTEVAGIATPDFYQVLPEYGQSLIGSGVQASFSQGCLPASLYSPESYQKTNAIALPYYIPLSAVHLPIALESNGQPSDPYTSRTQSSDLRVIEAAVEPGYRAQSDILELQFDVDLSDTLTLSSETSWASDFIFSTQDYNRFAGAPGAWRTTGGLGPERYVSRGILSPEGVFCDPQIGCSDRLVAMDLSTAQSTQFSQELRLASNYNGPLNFSLGANYLRYDTEDKYYVFINSISLISAYLIDGLSLPPEVPYIPNVTDNRDCLTNGMVPPDYTEAQPILRCTYIDPNPIENLNDLGHNYFLSRNPYKLISYAAFGELYYNIADNLKLTAGLRLTVDKKEAPLIPSWILAADTVGHPTFETVNQEWNEPTGRLALDWKPELPFTDETMVYASYAHGYKAGGMNPPPYGKTLYGVEGSSISQAIAATSALQPKTFDPEFVDALELGAKNTLLDGALTLNLAAFYYDYEGYQLSQIVNRSAVTHNFDADIWGLELEADWRPAENLKLGLKLGYEETKVADGERAIDVMDRTAGEQGWLVHRPFPSIPSNCVLPEWLFVGDTFQDGFGNLNLVNVGGKGGGNPGGCEVAYLLGHDPAAGGPFVLDPADNDPMTKVTSRDNVNYGAWSTDPLDYPCWPAGAPIGVTRDYPGVDPECLAALSNNGEGFYKDLSGKELPNAPNMTATLTVDYTLPLPNDWLMTLHSDLYYQSESWTRIFNTDGYDKLKAYTNVNLAAIFTNEEQGWRAMFYVKNAFNRDSITGAFLNSDDTGLTTNVFLTEPRLYGVRVTKDFTSGPWWVSGRIGFPLTVELSGQVQRHEALNEALSTSWSDALPSNIALQDIQDRDLDWGDGRSMKLIYKPAGSAWSISGAVRYGRTNTGTTRINEASEDVIQSCSVPLGHYFYNYVCVPTSPYYMPTFRNVLATSWSDAEAAGREEHEFVDFAVGRDFGLGEAVASTVSAGLRHAQFESQSRWLANAQTDWDIPAGWQVGGSASFERKHASLSASREFDGAGPMVSWDAGARLWGDDQTGRLGLDWSIGAGALFGERQTTIAGQERIQLHDGQPTVSANTAAGYSQFITVLPASGAPVVTPISISRTQDATVPVLDLSLGLSYGVGRTKVGVGYRWERYFDVLDVGYQAEATADRTIDGPYVKVSMDFGG